MPAFAPFSRGACSALSPTPSTLPSPAPTPHQKNSPPPPPPPSPLPPPAPPHHKKNPPPPPRLTSLFCHNPFPILTLRIEALPLLPAKTGVLPHFSCADRKS